VCAFRLEFVVLGCRAVPHHGPCINNTHHRRRRACAALLQDFISQDLVPLVDEFAGRLFGELDYVAEGRNCERFTELYANVPRIRTPSILCAAPLAHSPLRVPLCARAFVCAYCSPRYKTGRLGDQVVSIAISQHGSRCDAVRALNPWLAPAACTLRNRVSLHITSVCSWDCTTRRVLTMEWIEGVKLTNKEAMSAAGHQITDFVDVGIECTLRQLLEHGYFHADPHPGEAPVCPLPAILTGAVGGATMRMRLWATQRTQCPIGPWREIIII
jgi:ABC1 atypical kinase-like domain